MLTTKTRLILAALCTLALAAGGSQAASTHETTIEFDEALRAVSHVRIENLVGTIHVRGVDAGEPLRIEGQVLAEAKTGQEARLLAETVHFTTRVEGAERTIHVAYPTARHRQFRVPAVGLGGLVGKWVTPILRKSTVSLQYGEDSIQVGQQRGAAAISVDLTVYLPFDMISSFQQVVGSVDLNAVRGDVTLEVIEGRIDAEQVFGSLAVRSGAGDVRVLRFQGERLDIHSGAGAVELFDVRVKQAELTTTTGLVSVQKFEGGPTTLRTGSADIELAQFETEALTIESQSGSVTIATQLRGLIGASIESGTGDVVLRIASHRGFDVSARTKSGDITAYRMELEIVNENGKTIARRGRGGPTLPPVAS